MIHKFSKRSRSVSILSLNSSGDPIRLSSPPFPHIQLYFKIDDYTKREWERWLSNIQIPIQYILTEKTENWCSASWNKFAIVSIAILVLCVFSHITRPMKSIRKKETTNLSRIQYGTTKLYKCFRLEATIHLIVRGNEDKRGLQYVST